MAENADESRVLIVIDGPNVGMSHSGNKWPASASGIVTAITYYADLGYEVYAFVPRHYLSDNAGKKGVDNPALLRGLKAKGTVVSVPSQDHDDDYWLHFAWQQGAFAVTNDRMKDHVSKYPDSGEEGFYKWRDAKVISYTFAGDIFLPNPSFEVPKPSKKPDKKVKETNAGDEKKTKKTPQTKQKKGSEAQMKSGELPTVRKSRKAFRNAVRARLSDGSVNCGLLASEITALVGENIGCQFANRKELMGAMNIKTSNPFHEQLVELMGGELKVDLVKGQPVDVHLRSAVVSASGKGSGAASQSESKKESQNNPVTQSSNQSSSATPKGNKSDSKNETKKRTTAQKMSLADFKQALSENNLDKLKISIYQLPPKVEKSIPFLAEIELPANYADVGNQFKTKFGYRISSVFKNMDNLILFMNFRFEFPYNDLGRDGDLILRQPVGSKVEKTVRSGGLISWIKSLFSSN